MLRKLLGMQRSYHQYQLPTCVGFSMYVAKIVRHATLVLSTSTTDLCGAHSGSGSYKTWTGLWTGLWNACELSFKLVEMLKTAVV